MSTRGLAYVTQHAIARFQQHVARGPISRVVETLLDDLRRPIAWKLLPCYEGRPCLLLAIDDEREYIAALIRNDQLPSPPWVVVTVMPAYRKLRRRRTEYPRWLERGWQLLAAGESWMNLDIRAVSAWDAEPSRERRGA